MLLASRWSDKPPEADIAVREFECLFRSGPAIRLSIQHGEIAHCSELTGIGRGCVKSLAERAY